MPPLAPPSSSDPRSCWRDVTTSATVIHGLTQLLLRDAARLGTVAPPERARLLDRLRRLQAASTTLTQRVTACQRAAAARHAGGAARDTASPQDRA